MFGLRSGEGILNILEKGNSKQICKKFEGSFHSNLPNGKGKLTTYENGDIKDCVYGFWTKGKLTSV